MDYRKMIEELLTHADAMQRKRSLKGRRGHNYHTALESDV